MMVEHKVGNLYFSPEYGDYHLGVRTLEGEEQLINTTERNLKADNQFLVFKHNGPGIYGGVNPLLLEDTRVVGQMVIGSEKLLKERDTPWHTQHINDRLSLEATIDGHSAIVVLPNSFGNFYILD